MADAEIPAAGSATTNAEAVTTETPSTTTTVDSAASTATVEPSKAAPKPDLATLLTDPETRKELWNHPEVKKELEHRVSSERGRVKADLERQVAAQQADWQRQQAAFQDRARLSQMDEVELGEEFKRRLAAQDYDAAIQSQLQARLAPMRDQMEVGLMRMAGEELFGAALELAQEAGASEEEITQLNPQNYPSLREYAKGMAKFFGTKEGKKLAKDMAKTEAKAMLEEQAAAEREKTPGPANLSAADPAMGDTEFAAAYGTGKTNDTARQIRWMRANGIPI
ncbi:MAG: hypothetical protein Q7O66_16695 [Dehalococcoidia bacterium]|nr:hypothetical protein [Dehalococcoidia bacterium]